MPALTPLVRSLTLAAVLVAGCVSSVPASDAPASLAERPARCNVASEPWIGDWLSAWELTSDSLLGLPRVAPPTLFLYDETCVWTTSAVSAPGAPTADGPRLFGQALPWRSVAHGDSLTLPDSSRVPVGLMSYTSTINGADPFFVMASPGFWERAGVTSDALGHEPFVTGVFLHEFSHARHVEAFTAAFDSIEASWAFEEPFTSDVVQERFGPDSAYEAAFEAEISALRRAAAAGSVPDAQAAAAEGLRLRRARLDRYFTGDEAVFRTIDDVLISTEGAAQWAAFAWLAHPSGAGLPEEAVLGEWGTRGGQVRTSGLALFRVVDRLMPGWPSLIFSDRMAGATSLLELAVRESYDE